MARRLFVRRAWSMLALVLVCTAGFRPATASSAHQIDQSAWNQESPAAVGDLDLTFGNSGLQINDFFGNYDAADSLALQPDGKIVVAGAAYHSTSLTSSDFALARYNPDGSLDAGFGAAGKLTTNFFGNYDQANAVAIQPDGNIVAVGAAGHSFSTIDFAMVRYHADGSLDQAFGSGGKLVTDFFGKQDNATSLAIQPDGKIVLAGWAQHGDINSTADFALARYNPDGSLDQGFGSGGKVTTDFFGNEDLAYGIALQPDGKLVLAGLTFNPGTQSDDFALARYNPDGTLDQSFGSGGKQTTDFFGGFDYAAGVAIQADGKIVLAGTAGHGNIVSTYDFALARYNQDGSIDQTFGAAGKQTTDFFGDVDGANGVAIQADGKIVAAGFGGHSSSTADLALARYNSDGSLDQTFGVGGRRTTNLQNNSQDNDTARAVAIQPDGRIVATGNTEQGITFSSADFAIARYNGSPVAPDFSIGLNASSITAQAGSKISVTVLVNRVGGFSANVTINPPAASSGIKPKPPAAIVTSSGSANFKMKVGSGVPPGSYSRTFTATDDSGRTRTATLTIVVQ